MAEKLKKEQIQIIVMCAIVFIALFTGTYMIFYSPASSELLTLKNKQNTIMKQLQEKQKIAAEVEPMKKTLDELILKTNEYKKMAIRPSEFDFFRDTIRDMGNEYNVRVNRENMNNVDESVKSVFKTDLNYPEKEINLDISCKYHEFGSLLNRIENTSPFRKITKINISKRSDSRSGQLSINLTILSLLKENTA